MFVLNLAMKRHYSLCVTINFVMEGIIFVLNFAMEKKFSVNVHFKSHNEKIYMYIYVYMFLNIVM